MRSLQLQWRMYYSLPAPRLWNSLILSVSVRLFLFYLSFISWSPPRSFSCLFYLFDFLFCLCFLLFFYHLFNRLRFNLLFKTIQSIWLLKKKKKAAFLLTKWQQREKLLSINVTQQVRIIKDGCGSGDRASHPPVRRAAFWSLTPLLWLLKCPWARFWTLDYPRSIHWSICVCLMLEKLFKA